MKKQNNKNKNAIKSKKTIIAIIALVLIALIGGTYAWLNLSIEGEKKIKIKAGTLSLVLEEGVNIDIEDSVPMLDDEGLNTDPYSFKLINNGDIKSKYVIYLIDDDISSDDVRFDDNVIKYGLQKDGGSSTIGLLSSKLESTGKRVLESGEIEAGKTIAYELRLWVDENAGINDVQVDVNGTDETTGEKLPPKAKVFSGKLKIEASQTKE